MVKTNISLNNYNYPILKMQLAFEIIFRQVTPINCWCLKLVLNYLTQVEGEKVWFPLNCFEFSWRPSPSGGCPSSAIWWIHSSGKGLGNLRWMTTGDGWWHLNSAAILHIRARPAGRVHIMDVFHHLSPQSALITFNILLYSELNWNITARKAVT